MAGTSPRRNPYLAAYRRQWRHRLRTAGGWLGLLRWALPVAVCFLLVPLVQPIFLGFLADPQDTWGAALHGLSLRAGLLVVAVLALDVFTALIRSPDRAVLDLHPVDARQVVAFELVRVFEERLWLPIGLAILLLPAGVFGSWLAWGLLAATIGVAFVVGLTLSAFVHLGAVGVADNPRYTAMLDLARGSNPRAQAAFIYAPGVVLAAGGGLLWISAQGVVQVWAGAPRGWLLLVAPLPIAALCWFGARRLAVRGWFKASPILADIDARWSALEGHEEGRRVYLDWMVERLPRHIGRYVLKDLRHGWRARRVWVTGPWLVGVAAALAAWSRAPAAPGNATALLVAGVALFASVGVLLDRDDPPFLAQWMPPASGRLRARLLVLTAWVFVAPWLPSLALYLRHGSRPAVDALAMGLAACVASVTLAVACARWPVWGLRLYGPVAAVGVASVTAWTTTWGGP